MNELPPFWDYMSDEDRGMWANPHLRQPLTQKYNDPRVIEMLDRQRLMASFPRGGLLEGDIPLPPNWGNLVDPEIGANDPKSKWYQFPEDQGLLNYGTDPNEASGWVDESGRYNAPMDYPKNAPNTPEHKQAYNFLRFNNLGGGI